MSLSRWLAAAFFPLVCGAAYAQYNITTLFLQGTPIPGSSNTWNVNPGSIPTMPLSISGKNVAFVQCTCNGSTQPTDGVWVEDWTTETFTQLVAPGVVPQGARESALTSFGGYALVAGNWVVFLGYTSAGDGFYAVPVKGGKVRVIADQNTILPGLGAPAVQYSFGNYTGDLPQSDGQHFVFYANSITGDGVFSANLNSPGLAVIAYSNLANNAYVGDLVIPSGLTCTSDPADKFRQPRVAGSNVAFTGTPSDIAPPIWLFVTPLAGFPLQDTCPVTGDIVYPATVAYNTPLPPAEPSTVGFDGSYIAMDALDNEYFSASGDGSTGLFMVNAAGITPILNTTGSLPGVGPPFAPAGGSQGIAAENGTLAFSVIGEYGLGITQNAGLFTYNGGKTVKVALGSGAGSGIFLASPATCAADLTGQVTVTQTPPRYNSSTQQYNSKVTVKNTGAQSLPAPVSAVFGGLTNVVATYGTTIPDLLNSSAGATTCLSPLGEAYLVLNGGKALDAGASVSVELQIAYPPPAASFSYTTRVVTGKTR